MINEYEKEMKLLNEIDYENLKKKDSFKTALEYKEKNRYSNILPNEHSLVKLENQRYINANYIKGQLFEIDKDYIVTQGPMGETILDFWLMIYEYQVPVILMLTKLIEGEKEKCFKYWPNINNKLIIADNYDGLEIINKSENKEKEVLIRKILLIKDKKERQVFIIQYDGWPDFGVPKKDSFKHLLKVYQSLIKDQKEPSVIHCSAGVGRTGSFVTIDIFSRQKKKQEIFEIVKKLKELRTGMVQTRGQLEFCYSFKDLFLN